MVSARLEHLRLWWYNELAQLATTAGIEALAELAVFPRAFSEPAAKAVAPILLSQPQLFRDWQAWNVVCKSGAWQQELAATMQLQPCL